MADRPLSARVAEQVRALCEQAGWSGRELSRRTGIKPAAVAEKLAGRSRFDLDDLDAIAAAAGVSPVDLVARAHDAR